MNSSKWFFMNAFGNGCLQIITESNFIKKTYRNLSFNFSIGFPQDIFRECPKESLYELLHIFFAEFLQSLLLKNSNGDSTRRFFENFPVSSIGNFFLSRIPPKVSSGIPPGFPFDNIPKCFIVNFLGVLSRIFSAFSPCCLSEVRTGIFSGVPTTTPQGFFLELLHKIYKEVL